MKSEVIKIPLDNHKIAYCLFKHKLERETKSLVIIIPGLTESYDSYLINYSSDCLYRAGFDVICINLYDYRSGARLQTETDLEEHAKDINKIIGFVRDKYLNIFLVGHSLGGLAVMIANPPCITAASLWDPSFAMNRFWNSDNYKKINHDYVWSEYGFVVTQKMFNQIKSYDESKCLRLSAGFSSPVQVITADNPENTVFSKDKYSFNSCSVHMNERIFIKNADHCFSENCTINDLVQNVIRWFSLFTG